MTYTVARTPQAITLRFDQRTPETEIPVAIQVRMTDGQTVEHQVRLDRARQDVTLPVTGAVRDIRVNHDRVALARFSQQRTDARP